MQKPLLMPAPHMRLCIAMVTWLRAMHVNLRLSLVKPSPALPDLSSEIGPLEACAGHSNDLASWQGVGNSSR